MATTDVSGNGLASPAFLELVTWLANRMAKNITAACIRDENDGEAIQAAKEFGRVVLGEAFRRWQSQRAPLMKVGGPFSGSWGGVPALGKVSAINRRGSFWFEHYSEETEQAVRYK